MNCSMFIVQGLADPLLLIITYARQLSIGQTNTSKVILTGQWSVSGILL